MSSAPSTINDYFQKTVHQLSVIYDENEAKGILRIYFEDVLGVKNFARKADFTEKQLADLEHAVARMLQYEPVQYIVGEADFFGYKFKVTPAVLIPRPETEELVDLIVQQQKKQVVATTDFQMIDIGTGSGCIPIILKKKLPRATICAVDVSAEALAIATENARRNAVEINFTQLDILNTTLWQQFYDQSLSVVVSNPPYIPYQEQSLMAKNVLDYEPHLALFVMDEHPLIFYKVIACFAQQKLKIGGHLYFECNEFNANEVQKMLLQMGFTEVIMEKDMSGKERMITAQWQG